MKNNFKRKKNYSKIFLRNKKITDFTGKAL